MSDYDVDGVFDADAEITDEQPSLGNLQGIMKISLEAMITALRNARSSNEKRQAANALLKFLQSQGIRLEGEDADAQWVPPPEYNAKLAYHLALLFGEGGLSEQGSRRTNLADAAVRASAIGHTDGPVFEGRVDQKGQRVDRDEGEVYIKTGKGVAPREWRGAQLVEYIDAKNATDPL